MPTHGPLKYVARDLIQEMDTVLAPVLLDDGVSVAKRDRALHDYIQMMR